METLGMGSIGGRERKRIILAIRKGQLFLYPTDTVYGLGCNALKGVSVRKIRELKGTGHPFSVIAPSKKWIRKQLKVRHPRWLERLPGPYTLILEKKRRGFLKECSPGSAQGVRIPAHPFSLLVRAAGVPFVTTSANISGKRTIAAVAELPEGFRKAVDIAVDGGTLRNRPSRILDLTGPVPREMQRKGRAK